MFRNSVLCCTPWCLLGGRRNPGTPAPWELLLPKHKLQSDGAALHWPQGFSPSSQTEPVPRPHRALGIASRTSWGTEKLQHFQESKLAPLPAWRFLSGTENLALNVFSGTVSLNESAQNRFYKNCWGSESNTWSRHEQGDRKAATEGDTKWDWAQLQSPEAASGHLGQQLPFLRGFNPKTHLKPLGQGTRGLEGHPVLRVPPQPRAITLHLVYT